MVANIKRITEAQEPSAAGHHRTVERNQIQTCTISVEMERLLSERHEENQSNALSDMPMQSCSLLMRI